MILVPVRQCEMACQRPPSRVRPTSASRSRSILDNFVQLRCGNSRASSPSPVTNATVAEKTSTSLPRRENSRDFKAESSAEVGSDGGHSWPLRRASLEAARPLYRDCPFPTRAIEARNVMRTDQRQSRSRSMPPGNRSVSQGRTPQRASAAPTNRPALAETETGDLGRTMSNSAPVSHQLWASKAFGELDQDADGQLVTCELRSGAFIDKIRGCITGKLPDSAIDPLVAYVIRRADADGNGSLSRREFVGLTWRLRQMEVDLNLEADFVFSMFDQRGSGTLTKDEFRQLFDFHSSGGLENSDNAHVEKLMAELDVNRDGKITMAEYRQWWSSISSIDVGDVTAASTDDLCRWRGFARDTRREHQSWAAKLFKELDLDSDGRLTKCELRSGMFLERICECLHGILPKVAEEPLVDFLMRRADVNGDGCLTLAEFEAFSWKLRRLERDPGLEREFVFSLFDSRRAGTLHLEDFTRLISFHSGHVLGNKLSSVAQATMRELDGDGDGEITIDEYSQWRSGTRAQHGADSTSKPPVPGRPKRLGQCSAVNSTRSLGSSCSTTRSRPSSACGRRRSLVGRVPLQ